VSVEGNHAQRLLDRGFLLVVRALYGIDVVLRIIGDDEEMDQVEEIVGSPSCARPTGSAPPRATPIRSKSRFISPRSSSPSTRR
jgi:hypothetical protein